MPYVLLRQDLNPGSWSVQGTPDLDMTAFRTGSVLKEQIQTPIRLDLNEGSEIPSDYIETPYFIVSDAMKKVLIDGGVDNIEYFEVILRHPVTEKEFGGFWLGNILGLVSCVDEKNSKYRGSGQHKILRQFEIDENRAHGILLFRLAESTRLVLISDGLRTLLKSSGLAGLYLQNTNVFDGKPASSVWD